MHAENVVLISAEHGSFPSSQPKPWTREEDAKLSKAVARYNLQEHHLRQSGLWKNVARYVGTRDTGKINAHTLMNLL